jgi:acetolactate synthase-1/2/3 large subunit
MQSEPRGPVYLMMQRETLAQSWNVDQVRSYGADEFGVPEAATADPEVIARIVQKLLTAESPILVTGYAGRNVRASDRIAELAELAGIAVFEGNGTNNISQNNPCFLGFQPEKHLPKADVGLLVDVDVPWFPADVEINPRTYWAHIDIDVLKPASPMWTFPGNVRLQGDSGRILEQVIEALRRAATPKFTAAAKARLARLKEESQGRRERAAKLAADKGKSGEINPHYICAELAKLLDDNDIVFNEAIRNAGAALMQIDRPVPNTMMRSGGGGLGWSAGMALGAKLAAPDRMMVQIAGDGSFYFNNPSSIFSLSRQYDLPILSIILDNAGWSAVKASTLRVFPGGEAKASNEFESELATGVDFGKVGEAFGAYGEKLADPADVPAALKRCVEAVRGGRSAILHAHVTRL